MATARKLPSGRWRVQVYDRETKKCISITEDTKRKAEYAALEWQLNQKRREMVGMTVGEAIDKYIDGRRGVLSPSTIQGYESIKKYYLSQDIADTPLSSITQEMVQSEVMRLSNETSQRTHKKISAKTVHNFHGLLSGTFKEFAPSIQIDTALPKIQKQFIELPPVEDVIKAIKGTDIELPCMLAMWLSLSVSEIRGIGVDAIKDGVLTVKETCVQVDGVAVYKEATKAYERTRKLAIPQYIMNLIEQTNAYKNGSGYIETRSVTAIGCRFRRVLEKAGVEHMTFHQLRHMNASIMAMLNIPERYAQERGGWKTPHTMKRVYQHTFSQERQAVDDTIDRFFEDTIGAD